MGFPLGNLLYSSCPPVTGRSKLIAGDALCAGNSVPDTEFQESVAIGSLGLRGFLIVVSTQGIGGDTLGIERKRPAEAGPEPQPGGSSNGAPVAGWHWPSRRLLLR